MSPIIAAAISTLFHQFIRFFAEASIQLRTNLSSAANMLPPELLQVVFEALSRDDLDVLVLTRFSFSEIVLRDFVKTPFRYVAELNICGHKDYEFLLPTGDKYTCKDDDDLCRRMGLARVGELK